MPWSQIHASLCYEDEVAYLIQRLKFSGEYHLIHALSDWMIEYAPSWLDEALALPLIPIPSTRHSLQSRGFNQTVALAHLMRKKLKFKSSVCHALHRIESRVHQSSLGRDARWDNMAHAFTTNTHCLSSLSKGCLLIDDIMTTGATILSAAQSLKQSGSGPIYVWILARTPLISTT